MKLQCSVTVINRLLPALSMKSSTKYKNAVICLSENSKRQEIQLVLVTKNNKGGYRYEIRGNTEKIFDHFIKQGKCTIRFKEPCHDLCINSEAILLKRFLSSLKQVLNDPQSNIPGLSKSIHVASKTLNTNSDKLEIKKKEDYPTMKGFARCLKTLLICNCNLLKFDSRILKLSNLTTLSFNKNKLKELPIELGGLLLKQLCLSNNKLCNEKWVFLSGRITNSLEYLDISGNEINYLSPILSRFNSLRVLKASNNYIQSIPPRICLLPKLLHLDISGNKIRTLPGTITRKFLKKLDLLDISGNEGLSTTSDSTRYSQITSIHKDNHNSFFSLLELSAQWIIHSRLKYNEQNLPCDMVKLLDNAGQCSCGKIVIQSYGLIYHAADPKTITNTIVSSERQGMILLTFSSCSQKYNTYQ